MKIRPIVLAVAACALAFPVLAQQKANEHSAHHGASAADLSDGEIRKVDKGAAKVTIKHGEIKNLDMPGMTMVFQVKDPALLDKVKAGDKVKFKAANDGGKFTVTDLQVVQ